MEQWRAGIRRLIKVVLWGMDIDPTAMIASTAYIDRTWPRGVHIGAGTHIGEEAVVLTHDFTRGVYFHTRIGADCHVGPRAIVLPGLTIGDGCVVMPGALVTRDMPPGSIATGNPAEIKPLSH
ncbi:MAG TPA: DapH/DapD/GlmU-related protein [Caulobacteraceae bacterium]